MFSAMKVFIMCFLSIIMLGSITTVHGSVRRYTFELVNSAHTRLCTNKTMLTVNGQFPGPTIYARRGDLIIVDLINRADKNISIHWHGVKMPRNPWSDGTSFITQCPVRPGTRFSQRIMLSDEEGTLWWHAHINWTRATVHGAIIILPPKGHKYPFPKPHAQVPLIIGDWWNSDMQEIYEDFVAQGRSVNQSDAFLLNGQPGHLYVCSKQEVTPYNMYKMRVEPGKTYLVRMINANMNYVFIFRIANHNITVVSTDAAYTKPLKSDYLVISPGQTIDFLLEANQPPSQYYMAAGVSATNPNFIPTTGIVEYVGNYTPPSSPPFPSIPQYDEVPTDFDKQLKSLANSNHPIDVPNNITEHVFFALAMNENPCTESSCEQPERLLSSVNNISFITPDDIDILDAYYRGIGGVFTTNFPDHLGFAFDFTQATITTEESRPRFGTAVKVVEFNEAVEIVFQSINYKETDHPMHLHGHSFYVVGSGIGNFDRSRDPLNYNLVDPPLMETTLVPKDGWTAVRFRANNPGVWFMHCHFERHQSWGMNMAFIVKDGKLPHEKMLPQPPDMPRCSKISSSPSNTLLSTQ